MGARLSTRKPSTVARARAVARHDDDLHAVKPVGGVSRNIEVRFPARRTFLKRQITNRAVGQNRDNGARIGGRFHAQERIARRA